MQCGAFSFRLLQCTIDALLLEATAMRAASARDMADEVTAGAGTRKTPAICAMVWAYALRATRVTLLAAMLVFADDRLRRNASSIPNRLQI